MTNPSFSASMLNLDDGKEDEQKLDRAGFIVTTKASW
jgi:hypothetical protein